MIDQTIDARVIGIFVGFVAIIIIFLYLIYKIFRYYRTRLNITFSGCYIFIVISLTINIIYILLKIPQLVIILNSITNYTVCFSTIFVTVFLISLYRGYERFSLRKQLSIILIYGLLLAVMFFIPGGVIINEETNWTPIWSWTLFIYVASVIIIISVIPTLFYSFKLYKKFEDNQIKRKWKYFIIGSIQLYLNLLGTLFINTLNIPFIRLGWYIFLIFNSISAAYLTYYGLAGKV
ncbi:MAG TPA: hypothetical protein VGB37_13095 [Candidatus Lokiarchaeia archaeon]